MIFQEKKIHGFSTICIQCSNSCNDYALGRGGKFKDYAMAELLKASYKGSEGTSAHG